jgi:hypothetical protein
MSGRTPHRLALARVPKPLTFCSGWYPHESVPDAWLECTLSLHRGEPAWAGDFQFQGYEKTPMLVVNHATEDEWANGATDLSEMWIYFRTRSQWKHAHRLARIMARQPFEHILISSHYKNACLSLVMVDAVKLSGQDCLNIMCSEEAA